MTSLETYLNQDKLPFPFCPGCGHSLILKALDKALVQLALPPEDVILVTDIGCTGLSDKYFITHAFHGLHGRSITYATGLRLAHPNKKVIVLIGDGGCGIGGHHLINAARRNLDLTVLVFNNFNYGMTGGEHSISTPPGAKTATTIYGQVEQPMDICGTVAVNGGTYVGRFSTFNKDLPDIISQAIQHRGFSLLDIWELCTSYFAVSNAFGKKAIAETLSDLEFETGVLVEKSKPTYLEAYREATTAVPGRSHREGTPLEVQFQASLTQPYRLVVAGAAGSKIISAATAFSRGAVLAGLWANQRSDYPVTVKTGHSLADIVLSPHTMRYAGVEQPDAVIILFEEGLAKVSGLLRSLSPSQKVFIKADLGPIETPAIVQTLTFDQAGSWGRKSSFHAVMSLSALLQMDKLFPLAAYREALRLRPRFADENIAALDASPRLLG